MNKLVFGLLCTLFAPAILCRGGEPARAASLSANDAIPHTAATHNYKAPLYWTIYEYAREWEIAGVPYDQMDLSSEQWDAVIDMMEIGRAHV